MAYTSGQGGYGSGAASVSHIEPSHADSVSIPDAELLFRGHFARSGPNLVLTGQDGHRHIVPGYFASEKHPALVAPNGAHLLGDLVELLSGSKAPAQYAQAQSTAPVEPIGQIEKVVGIANVVRNGVAVALHVGDKVYQSDVVQTGADSSCGIAFPDGTALNLVANTRMALNEYSFDANGTSNSALFTLVEGTFAFVAGTVAHGGNMKIGTPVATMGIRGTAGWSGHQLPLISSTLGDVYGFALAHDPGVDTFGRYQLYKHDLSGNPVLDANGNPVVLNLVGSPEILALCTIDSCTDVPMTSGLAAFAQGIMQGAYDAANAANGANPGTNGSHGSGETLPTLPISPGNGNVNPPLNLINFTTGTNNEATTTLTLTTLAFAETVQPEVTVTTPTQTLVIGSAGAISGVVVSETNSVSGETFTVTLSDSHGLLSATPTGTGDTVTGGGTTSLSIFGTLSQVNAVLKTLTDADTTPGRDTITVTATDDLGHSATPQTINVTVAGLPVITVPVPQTLDVNVPTAITGVSVSESGDTLGEIFTVTLTDSHGDLSANTVENGGGTITGSGTTSLTIRGTLSQVNSDLATLTDTTHWAGPDNIAVTATDSFGNSGTPATIGVTAPALASFSAGTNNYSDNENVAYSGPQISSEGSTLTLTNDKIGEYGSWFSNNTYSIDNFTGSFDYQAIGQADGIAFILQDDPRGNSALGTNFTVNGGSGLGYDGISPSAAVEFNVWQGHVQGTNFATDGSTGNYNSTGNVAFWNGDEIHVLLTYNGSVLTETLTDLVNGATYSASYTVNLAQILGSDVAYVGFSGGTGADASTQTISNFTFENGTVSSPAGVAGSPTNLALTDPSGGQARGPITLTFTGVPSGWSLNKGTNLSNGTWTVETRDLSALTVLTAAAYSGAMVLGVTETWTSANGSTETATVADNVEAYAPGTPIFALSGNDTLTGAGGSNEFVFAQPIGNDTIYNFNVANDKIDLMGFANIASFSDIKSNTADDGHGDAVITIGAGQTITLQGVNATSLTAADFVFNQTSVVENAGNMVISDGAVLPLSGTINNTGTITLNSTGDQTELQIVGDGVMLEGGGKITLSGDAVIIGTGSAAVLTNVDNTISGAGQIGTGDSTLTLVNQTHGTIDADVAGGTLTLEPGTVITNDGILEATKGGTLQIADPVIGSGSILIEGGTLVLGAPSNVNVAFDNGTETPTYGELVLENASGFSGQISGFSGTAPDVARSDAIDLVGINYDSAAFSETYNDFDRCSHGDRREPFRGPDF